MGSFPFYVLSFARPFSFGDLVTWRFVDLEHGDLSLSMICHVQSQSCSLLMPKSPNQKIKKSPNGRGGNGKAASHPARAHAHKDYASRNNIIEGLGRRWPGPPPTGPFGRRAAVASPAAHMVHAFRKVQSDNDARCIESQQKQRGILMLGMNSQVL
jgi:hypothetical protein